MQSEPEFEGAGLCAGQRSHWLGRTPVAPETRSPFSYLILRAAPSLERSKRVNVGVVPSCRQPEFLDATAEVAPARLVALGEHADPAEVADPARFELSLG